MVHGASKAAAEKRAGKTAKEQKRGPWGNNFYYKVPTWCDLLSYSCLVTVGNLVSKL